MFQSYIGTCLCKGLTGCWKGGGRNPAEFILVYIILEPSVSTMAYKIIYITQVRDLYLI